MSGGAGWRPVRQCGSRSGEHWAGRRFKRAEAAYNLRGKTPDEPAAPRVLRRITARTVATSAAGAGARPLFGVHARAQPRRSVRKPAARAHLPAPALTRTFVASAHSRPQPSPLGTVSGCSQKCSRAIHAVLQGKVAGNPHQASDLTCRIRCGAARRVARAGPPARLGLGVQDPVDTIPAFLRAAFGLPARRYGRCATPPTAAAPSAPACRA
jgi:hypothetical protein